MVQIRSNDFNIYVRSKDESDTKKHLPKQTKVVDEVVLLLSGKRMHSHLDDLFYEKKTEDKKLLEMLFPLVSLKKLTPKKFSGKLKQLSDLLEEAMESSEDSEERKKIFEFIREISSMTRLIRVRSTVAIPDA